MRVRPQSITEESLTMNIERIRHGGSESIITFLRVGMSLFKTRGVEALQSWITIALPALPERESAEIVTSLLIELLKSEGCVQSEPVNDCYRAPLH